MLLFLRPSNGLSIVFIRPFKGLFELCLWFPASLTGPNLFSFEANKWTQLKLEPALFLALHSRTNCVFQRPSHGLIIAFTHKMRIFLRPSHGLSFHSRTNCVYPWGRTWTQHCIHAQNAYIPEAVHGLSIAFTHKLRIFLRPTSGLICTIRNLLFKLRSQVSLYLQNYCR